MNKLTWKSALAIGIACVASLTVGLAVQADAAPNSPGASQFFPFVIPWDDASGGTATDVSWLNHGPAGAGGFIVAKNGHFYESKTGNRVRFLGTNFTFDSDFPKHEDAAKVAAHLAKLGINIVRIHHHDADYGQLWDKRFPDHQHFDQDAIDRLDYLIYQLKLHGIYVDLNLHVSRQFTPADGFPDSVNDIATGYDKQVDYFEPRMIALQKSFARQYLDHVNPYTKLAYTKDPCVAIIEINNENSLVDDVAQWGGAGGLDKLPEPFRGELVARWNDWLKGKYGSDAKLADAWTQGEGKLGGNTIPRDAAWGLEQGNTTAAERVVGGVTAPGASESTAPDHFHIIRVDGTDWHVQAGLAGLNLAEGRTYSVSFMARADNARSMGVYVGTDISDWHNIGLNTTVQVTPEWRSYAMSFTATNVAANHNRLVFVLGSQIGDLWLQDVRLQPGASIRAMIGVGDLASSTIPMPVAATQVEHNDWMSFLAATERRYAGEMRTYIKNDLGAHANIICTQISWGNAEGLYREQYMEFADNHNYWQHPSFPHVAWDSKDWFIGNTPMTANMASGGGGTLQSLAEYRVAGKPYTITEYNEPAPNDYRCEFVPGLASFAAAQDWDAIFLFDWGQYGGDAPNGKIQGFFACCSDPARAAFIPSAALIFRDGQTAPDSRVSMLTLPEADSISGRTLSTFWAAAGASDPDYLGARLSSRLSTTAKTPKITSDLVAGSAARENGPNQGRFVQHGSDPSSAYFTSGSSAVFGYLAGKQIELGDNGISVDPFGDGFCAITIASQNGVSKSTGVGHRVLVTIVGKAENENMSWNAARTSVGDQWGSAPSLAEFVPATISIPASSGAKVYALIGDGERGAVIASSYENSHISFHTDKAAQTVWYEVAW